MNECNESVDLASLSSGRPNVLMLLPEIPFPTTTGGKRAHYANLQELTEFSGKLTLVCANVDSTPSDVLHFLKNNKNIEITIVDTNHPSRLTNRILKIASRLRLFFSHYPSVYSSINQSLGTAVVDSLIEKAGFSHIWVDQLNAMAMLPKVINIPVILSTQNVESELLKDSYLATPRFSLRRFKRWTDWKKMQRIEARVLNRADKIICLSEHDSLLIAKVFGIPKPDVMLPKLFQPTARWQGSGQRSLLFVGQTTHAPNRDAVDWIVKELAPILFIEDQKIKIDIVGTTGEEFAATDRIPSLHFHGKVQADFLDNLMRSCGAMLCPVILGSGIKIKVLEGACNGIPIITTQQSLNGLGMLKNCLIIDRSQSSGSATTIVGAFNSPELLVNGAALNLEHLIKEYQYGSNRLQRIFQRMTLEN